MKYLELDNSEKYKTINLYREAFYEDSEKFIDYYYNRIDKNRVFACKNGDEIVSMIHLHPMTIHYNEVEVDTYYIIAVATLIKYRKRGIYSKLLQHTLDVLNNENIPIVFLMPAREEIYKPFGFETLVKFNTSLIYANENKYEFEKLNDENRKYIGLLSERYLSFFIKRTEEYIDDQINCLKAMNGCYYFAKKDGEYLGYLRYVGEDNSVLDIVSDDEKEYDILSGFAEYISVGSIKVDLLKKYYNCNEKINKYMYRIININAFIKAIGCINADNVKKLRAIKVIDEFITENNITINHDENEKIEIVSVADFLKKTVDAYNMKKPFIHEVI